ncbi:Target of rapamycin complex 1 subunit kog1 [Recurvomyces mirabilis]|uniref:Target of rapamycin complex 1 subunit kog1 n=1 Tax=Recurvomyces mirabilis TaxID=574656 RepID=A0AAE1C1F0_9PEZI|nr:Target of rapamycin complex 1 subunit kog1 [Recurvomyces mirabilis]KAK5154260.1 Target of rapamycin complex 1 subunit kog1 [Recurvomyces mirabilis]
MTRHATQSLEGAAKHPQPVLQLLPSDTSGSQGSNRPNTSSSQATGQMNGHHDAQDSDSDDGGLHMPAANGSRHRPAQLIRAKSDVVADRRLARAEQGSVDGGERKIRMRHGWEAQLKDQEQATFLSQTFYMYFEDKRHETAGNPPPKYDPKSIVSEWRMKDRLKTVSAILAVCLNVGVDPPDVIKTNPCARLECWVDPIPSDSSSSQSSNNSNAQIGKNLQSQYENLSLRTRYKVILDPTIEELRRYTTSLRRTAHAERILFHYNGHGVPKPTASGEVWCFNRSYTQYIPISLHDLQEWVGAPGLWVWDCSAAGGIIKGFMEAVDKHNATQQEALRRDANRLQQQPSIKWEDCIHLAACRDNEVLPTNPDLPADIFTSCLTTPIAMAVRFFILQNPIPNNPAITLETARAIPGKVSERRTPLGELNWIFTAITDTIAWNSLPPPLFKKLFRQDLMVAALFRNFLLAQRVMRMYHCHPRSWPQIPDTHGHPLWRSWDLAVEMILSQVPRLLEQQKQQEALTADSNQSNVNAQANGAAAPTQTPQQPTQELEYQHSDFFADQLSAFEVYLSAAPANSGAAGYAKPPEQLPIVLQVLLSQVHRLRALILLSKFLDLGPWAVNLALSIGIFPYVLKLLQSQALELKPPMVFIWARILAVDQSCQSDLLKDSGYTYFTGILNSANGIPLGNVAEHRAMCAFVIAMFCKDFKPGKQAVLESNPEIIEGCLQHLLDMENPLLRQWSCLCMSNLWKDFEPAKRLGLTCQAHARIRDRSHDPVPEVRAACLEALTSFVFTGTGETIDAAVMLEEETLASVVVAMGMDGSIMVRKELTIFYATFIKKYEKRFLVAAWEQLLEEKDKRQGRGEESQDTPTHPNAVYDGSHFDGPPPALNGVNGEKTHARAGHRRTVSFTPAEMANDREQDDKPTRLLSKKTIYRAMWRQILTLSADPHPEVARNASIVVDFVISGLLDSPLGDHANKILDEIVITGLKRDQITLSNMDGLTRQRSRDQRPQTPPSPTASTASKADGYFPLGRTASVAAAMRNFFGVKTPLEEPSSPARSRHNSIVGQVPSYAARPLTPADAAMLPPDALDRINGPPHQPKAKVPPSPYFVPRDLTQVPEVPLQSNFFTWSASYFREPQMRPSEADEPGSLDYNERLWRRNRNDKIIASTQPLKEAAGSQRWDVPCGYFGIGAAPIRMVFHQFENHLVTSDDRDSIAVWDWKAEKQLCRFSNGNPHGSRITELRFINEDDQAMLMTGASDGVIKIFRHYDDPKKIELASSFRALSDLVISDKQNAGLVFDWQQGQGRVLVAGDDRVIRVWQAGHELCVADIPARSGSCITSLTSDQVEGNVFVAGFGNGSVRAYDQRMSPRESMIMDWTDRKTDHRSWIVGVHLQRGGMRELISAESNGGVRLWDIRSQRAVSALGNRTNNSNSSGQPRNLRTLAVHEHAPVFATGGADHTIRVYNTTEMRQLSVTEPYMSLLRMTNVPRNAPITATAFHPHRMMMACGAVNDGHVNLFKCEAVEEEKRDGGIVDEWSG